MRLKISRELLPKFKSFCSSPELIMMFGYMKCRFSLNYRDLEGMIQKGQITGQTKNPSSFRNFANLMAA
jgi:hypothetical protein